MVYDAITLDILNKIDERLTRVLTTLQGIRGTAVDSGTSSRFKQFDPLAFVVIVLNFLREDTAPLLAPSGDRPQAGDQPSPTKDSAAGEKTEIDLCSHDGIQGDCSRCTHKSYLQEDSMVSPLVVLRTNVCFLLIEVSCLCFYGA